jgi:RNA polymerase sigma factor (sigma-70 family)
MSQESTATVLEVPAVPENQDTNGSSSFNRRSRLAKDPQTDLDLDRLYLNDIGRHRLLNKDDEQRLGKIMEDAHVAEAELATSDLIFSPQRIQQLLETVESGEQAAKTMVTANLRLVVSIAKRYKASGLPLLELIQEGNLGLMHAVKKFDYTRGFKFSTYASWWIRQSITRGIDNTGRAIRLPVHAGRCVMTLRKQGQSLHDKLGRPPTEEELMNKLGWDEHQLKQVQADASRQPLSLNEQVGEDDHGMEFGDQLGDPASSRAFESLGDDDLHNKRIIVLKTVLNPTELFAVGVYNRLVDGEQRSLDEVNELLRERFPGNKFNRDKLRKLITGAVIKLQHPAAYQDVKQALDNTDDHEWKEYASCKESGVDQFVNALRTEMIPTDEVNETGKKIKVHPLARAYCASCAVSATCKVQGDELGAQRGIWGGVVFSERTSKKS